jgi:GNAT superfamily N-acetyltransferase
MSDSDAGYELDDDKGRLDIAVAWKWLSTEAYWGTWRDQDFFVRQVEAAWRVVGAYERRTGAMVGFARAVSDGVSLAYLADVFVLPEHRGAGLGEAIVRRMIDEGPGAGFRWLLHTADAHGLYERYGFRAADSSAMERPGNSSTARGRT